MYRRLKKTALVDSGFWIALLYERDNHHTDAMIKSEILRNLIYIVPWPTLYETLNSRLVRRPGLIRHFVEAFLKRPNAVLWNDGDYRDSALNDTLSDELISKRPLSLVDNVLRQIIADKKIKLNYLFTFNVGDFADICKRRNLEII
jgi:predicted nucleic acid-binding protein